MQLHRDGNLVEAEEIYRKLLQVCPDHPDILHYLGVACHQLGRSEEALTLMRQSLERAPRHGDYHANLAHLLVELDRPAEAEQACRAALELQPENLAARNNLGVILKRTGRLEEAEREYRAILARVPDHSDALCNLVTVLERQDRLQEAAELGQRAVTLKAQEGRFYQNLARTLRKIGNLPQARAVVQDWLRFDPQNPIALHTLQALQGDGSAGRCSAEYVQQTFDEFAADFDQVLGSLHYSAPEVLRQELAARLPAAGGLRILDAGCGTGLAAPVLRPLARRLVGVDLSPKMLQKARQRGGYDELVPAELGAYLTACAETFDLIVSMDTLLYFGDLREVLLRMADRLADQGLLVFSTERLLGEEGPPGYVLEPSGRFAHHPDYLRRTLAETGFKAVELQECSLRKECGQPVPSLLITARKA